MIYKMILTPEQLEAFSFDPDVMGKVKENLNTTDRQVFIINGGVDVWNFYGPRDIDNKNVHLYVDPKGTHMTSIYDLDVKKKTEIIGLMSDILGAEPEESFLKPAIRKEH